MTEQVESKALSWWKGKGLHNLFEIGVVLKGINAALELVFGILLLFVDVRGMVKTLTEHELIEDPNSFVATHLHNAVTHLRPGAELYTGLYLISHGAVKIVLVWGLLKKKLWAYPASIMVLALFILYQSITWIRTHSIALLLLTIFDVSLIYLILQEYRHVRRMWGVPEH